MSRTVENPPAAAAVEVVGAPSAEEREYAVEKIGSLTQYAPIRDARVTMHLVGDPFAPQSAEVRAGVTGDRLFVHADARGGSVNEAVDLVRARLYRLLTHRRRRPRHARVRSTLQREK